MAANLRKPRRIAVLLIDGYALMSFAAVTEPLRAANLIAGRSLYDVCFLRSGKDLDSAPASSCGAAIATTSIANASDAYALILVVAGGDPLGFHDNATFQWLRRQARHGHLLGGVSGGPAILAKAGVMEGRRMTVHWEHAAALAEQHPALRLERSLYIVDRDRMTCAGGTAPLDMMHAMIAEQHGAAFARQVSDWFMHTDVRPAANPQRAGLAERYGTTKRALLHALEAMENHIADPLTLRQLASIAEIGERQLNRQFQADLGRSAIAFYRDLRLDKSLELLRQTDMPLLDIALAAGFGDAAHFSTAFKSRFGQPPSTLRRSART